MSRNFATSESIGKIKSKALNFKYGPQWFRPKGKSMSDEETNTADSETPQNGREQKSE